MSPFQLRAIKNPRQQKAEGAGSMGRSEVSLEAHPHIRRGAQQQAQQATGLRQEAIDSMLGEPYRQVKLGPGFNSARSGGAPGFVEFPVEAKVLVLEHLGDVGDLAIVQAEMLKHLINGVEAMDAITLNFVRRD